MRQIFIFLALLVIVSGLRAQDIDKMNETLRKYQIEINNNRSFLEERVNGGAGPDEAPRAETEKTTATG